LLFDNTTGMTHLKTSGFTLRRDRQLCRNAG